MTNYQVFCESCGTDYEVNVFDNKKIKYCTVCGSELDESSISESDGDWEEDSDDEDDWENDLRRD
jgi:rRNA maturation endonuclease Nob1